MKNINGYWIDGNNNKWNENIYTKEQAELNSRTLVHCSYCRDCSDCSYCRNCSDCSENPQRYTTAKIGSRDSNTTFYWIKDVVQVVCGCFRGSLQEFEDKVKATYGRKKFGLQYTKEIKKVKYLVKGEITK